MLHRTPKTGVVEPQTLALSTASAAIGAPWLREKPAAKRRHSRTVRRRQTRDRMRRLRERTKKYRRDPISYFEVPLPESVIHQLVAELKVNAKGDVPVNDRTWRSFLGLVIADVVKSTISKKL